RGGQSHTTAFVRFASESGHARLVATCRLRASSVISAVQRTILYSITSSPPAIRRTNCPDLTSRRQDDGLAGRLRVEEPVGFLGLLEPPAVREEPLHVHLPLGDELGALGLALLRERPRPHQRDLPAQQIRADVERDLTPLADETGGAPRAYGAHCRGTGVRRRGGVERLVRALAVGELAYRRDRVV